MFFSGFLEMTQGVKNASLLNTSILNKALCMLGAISFGGLSVHAQILSILEEYPISYLKFLGIRILHVCLSCFLFFILFGSLL